MTDQLSLIDLGSQASREAERAVRGNDRFATPDRNSFAWQLDAKTCETGRLGVARARAALAAAGCPGRSATVDGRDLPTAA